MLFLCHFYIIFHQFCVGESAIFLRKSFTTSQLLLSHEAVLRITPGHRADAHSVFSNVEGAPAFERLDDDLAFS